MQVRNKMSIFAREINTLNYNMKRFFISAIVTMSCFMANAQTISIPEVNLTTGGEKTVSVSLEGATDYTAFQFDIALPTGVTVKSVGMDNKPDTRKIETGTVGDKFRVLSYDEGNAKFTSGSVLSLTFKAADDAATEEAETATISTIVVVKDDGTGPDDASGSVAINVQNGVQITIGAKEVTTLVSEKALDFSGDAVKAFIATGYNYDTNDILLTRVKDVPAETPILVMGKEGTYDIPATTSRIYYPENFLKGKATGEATVDNSGDFINMKLKDGQFIALSAETFQARKSYLQIPAASKIASLTGESLSFTMGANGTKSYTGKYDLDFEDVEGLTAFVVTGYDKDNNVWLTRVKKASANTPLVMLGTANAPYVVPSSAQRTSYVNMLRGDADKEITISKTNGEWTNLILKGGQFVGLSVESTELKAGASYLPIPTSIIAASRGEFVNGQQLNLQEAEVITMKAVIGGENDGKTGISRVASEVVNDVWYNLSGQRIDTPTKKGLYIKNGKKVIVK